MHTDSRKLRRFRLPVICDVMCEGREIMQEISFEVRESEIVNIANIVITKRSEHHVKHI
jgi:hypothetical protein